MESEEAANPLLAEVLPAFAAELEYLLRQWPLPELAGQIASLRVVGRCRCGDGFCATFRTAPRPEEGWGGSFSNVELEPERGMVILDVAGGVIVGVEVLHRPDVREPLLQAVP